MTGAVLGEVGILGGLKWLWGVIFAPIIWYIVRRNDKRYEDLKKENDKRYDMITTLHSTHEKESAEKFGMVTESIRGIHEANGEIKRDISGIRDDIKELLKKK